MIDESVLSLRPGDRVVIGGGWPHTTGRTFTLLFARASRNLAVVRDSDGRALEYPLSDCAKEAKR
jgi:hypothetical protein